MNPPLLLRALFLAAQSRAGEGGARGGAGVAAAATRILARKEQKGSSLLLSDPSSSLVARSTSVPALAAAQAPYYLRAITTSTRAPGQAAEAAEAAALPSTNNSSKARPSAAAAAATPSSSKPPPSPTAATKNITPTWYAQQYELDVSALARAVRQDDRAALQHVARRLDAAALAKAAPDNGLALLQVLLQAAARAGDAEVARAVVAAMRSAATEAPGDSNNNNPLTLAADAHRALLQALAQAGRAGEALRWLRDEVPVGALTAKHVVAVARPAMRAGDLRSARAAVDWGVQRQREADAGGNFDADETLASLCLQLAAAEGGAPAVRREWGRLLESSLSSPGVRAHLARLVALHRVASSAAAAESSGDRSSDRHRHRHHHHHRPASSSSAMAHPREIDEALDGLIEAYLRAVWTRWCEAAGGDSAAATPPQGRLLPATTTTLPKGPWSGRLPLSALTPAKSGDDAAPLTGPTPLERDLLARGLDTALGYYTSAPPSPQTTAHHQEQQQRRVLDARAALQLPPTARMYASLAQWKAQHAPPGSGATALDLEALAAEAAAFGALGAPPPSAGRGGGNSTANNNDNKNSNNNTILLSSLGLPFFEALGELYAATEGRSTDAERAALDRSRAAGLEPTARTYARLLHGLGGPGDVDAADRIYRRMVAAAEDAADGGGGGGKGQQQRQGGGGASEQHPSSSSSSTSSQLQPDVQIMARLFRAARTAAQNVRVLSAARVRAAGADPARRAAALADRAAQFAGVYGRVAAWQGDMARRGVRHDSVSLHHLAAALERLNALGDCLELAAAQERALLRHAARERRREEQEEKEGAASSPPSSSSFAAHRSALRVSGRRGGGGDAAGRVAALAERVRQAGAAASGNNNPNTPPTDPLSPEDYALVAFSQFWVHRDEAKLLETAKAMRRDGVRLDSATGHSLLHVYAARRLWREALGVVDELLELKGVERRTAGEEEEEEEGEEGASSSSAAASSSAASFGAEGDGVWHVALRELARHAAPDDVVGAFVARMSPAQRARFGAMYSLRRTGSGWALGGGGAGGEDGEEGGESAAAATAAT